MARNVKTCKLGRRFFSSVFTVKKWKFKKALKNSLRKYLFFEIIEIFLSQGFSCSFQMSLQPQTIIPMYTLRHRKHIFICTFICTYTHTLLMGSVFSMLTNLNLTSKYAASPSVIASYSKCLSSNISFWLTQNMYFLFSPLSVLCSSLGSLGCIHACRKKMDVYIEIPKFKIYTEMLFQVSIMIFQNGILLIYLLNQIFKPPFSV